MSWFRYNYGSILSILTTVMIGAILILLVNVQSGNAVRLKNQRIILNKLEKATSTLQDDNARQTRYIQCLLVAHGQEQLVSATVESQCNKMASNVKLEDIKTVPSAPAPVNTVSNTPAEQQPISAPRKPVAQFVCNVISMLGLCKP